MSGLVTEANKAYRRGADSKYNRQFTVSIADVTTQQIQEVASRWEFNDFYVPNIYIIHLYISEYCHLSLMETAHSQWLCVTVGGLELLLRTWRQCLDWNLNCLTSMKIHSSILNEEFKYCIGVDYEQNMSIHF